MRNQPKSHQAQQTNMLLNQAWMVGYGTIPGYMVWDARGEYHFGRSLSDLTLSAGIKNLFDQTYFTRSTDNNYGIYVGQPRTYYVQASVKF